MQEKIKKVSPLLQQIDEEVVSSLAVEIIENEYEINIRANRKGLLALAKQLVSLCGRNVEYGHYHLDDCSIAQRCDKPVVVTLVNFE